MAITINADFVAHHMTAAEICNALERRLVLDAAERQAAETAAAHAEQEALEAAERAKAAQALAAEQASDMQARAGTLATLTAAVGAQTWTPAPSYPVSRSGVPAAVRSKAAQMFLSQHRERVQ